MEPLALIPMHADLSLSCLGVLAYCFCNMKTSLSLGEHQGSSIWVAGAIGLGMSHKEENPFPSILKEDIHSQWDSNSLILYKN